MGKRRRDPVKPAPARNRPAVNFTLSPELKKTGDDTAERYGLFTAQGGEQRPRFSSLVGGFLLMLQRGQIDDAMLFEASYESVGLEPDVSLKHQIQRRAKRAQQHAPE
jgi:hypothetical protein